MSRVDARCRADKNLRRFHDLARDDPFGLRDRRAASRFRFADFFAAIEERGAGKERHRTIACGFVKVALAAAGDMTEQPAEDRTVNGVVVRVALVPALRAHLFERLAQLRMQVLPLAHPGVGKIMGATEFPGWFWVRSFSQSS